MVVQVRNMATLGGHVCWGHPASDILPCLILAGARVRVSSGQGVRETGEGGRRWLGWL